MDRPPSEAELRAALAEAVAGIEALIRDGIIPADRAAEVFDAAIAGFPPEARQLMQLIAREIPVLHLPSGEGDAE
ncbi:hypothetical protein BKE38_03170 [Pseudoroseomonas deserti]|uniref:Uncharacterized protein n=1 Tax=Teichococcus deserti TaxID=1817963 RepID=A0A1V2H776_9PROT|nr:hypothetical protein [Pseudoroseomonas deserti]ONG58266.1 hypothetical protein BKE38_03170 [Pseudoroseomonas deserti]